jgi:uncharacterized membrane protein YgcG
VVRDGDNGNLLLHGWRWSRRRWGGHRVNATSELRRLANKLWLSLSRVVVVVFLVTRVALLVRLLPTKVLDGNSNFAPGFGTSHLLELATRQREEAVAGEAVEWLGREPVGLQPGLDLCRRDHKEDEQDGGWGTGGQVSKRSQMDIGVALCVVKVGTSFQNECVSGGGGGAPPPHTHTHTHAHTPHTCCGVDAIESFELLCLLLACVMTSLMSRSSSLASSSFVWCSAFFSFAFRIWLISSELLLPPAPLPVAAPAPLASPPSSPAFFSLAFSIWSMRPLPPLSPAGGGGGGGGGGSDALLETAPSAPSGGGGGGGGGAPPLNVCERWGVPWRVDGFRPWRLARLTASVSDPGGYAWLAGTPSNVPRCVLGT